jgi:hypothetical protein
MISIEALPQGFFKTVPLKKIKKVLFIEAEYNIEKEAIKIEKNIEINVLKNTEITVLINNLLQLSTEVYTKFVFIPDVYINRDLRPSLLLDEYVYSEDVLFIKSLPLTTENIENPDRLEKGLPLTANKIENPDKLEKSLPLTAENIENPDKLEKGIPLTTEKIENPDKLEKELPLTADSISNIDKLDKKSRINIRNEVNKE